MTPSKTLLAVLLALGLAAARADDPAPAETADSKSLDKLLHATLRDVINRGRTMFNEGDHAGCYRLFEGALLTAKPLLGNRPSLQKEIDKALFSANQDPASFRRAFTLRAALDKVRKEINPNPKKDDPPPPPKAEKKDDSLPPPKAEIKEKAKPDPDKEGAGGKDKLPPPKTDGD